MKDIDQIRQFVYSYQSKAPAMGGPGKEILEALERVEAFVTELERRSKVAEQEAERTIGHDIQMRLRIRKALKIHDCAPLEESIVAVGAERDRFRAALERIKAKLSVTDVPQDQWVSDLHGELFAIAHYAINHD